MKRLGKKLCILILVIITILIVLNFVPIKFAVNIKEISHSDNAYVCSYSTATDGNWCATTFDNPNLTEDIWINIDTAHDFSCWNEIVGLSRGEPVLNKYVFYGEIEEHKVYDKIYFKYLKSSKWDIVYPIRRNSLRALFTPPHYLTIYDYNWVDVITNLISAS